MTYLWCTVRICDYLNGGSSGHSDRVSLCLYTHARDGVWLQEPYVTSVPATAADVHILHLAEGFEINRLCYPW